MQHSCFKYDTEMTRMFSPLTAQKNSSVFIWPVETTPNVPSPMFWLEMVTMSEDNSVCEGKMAIIASFLLIF